MGSRGLREEKRTDWVIFLVPFVPWTFPQEKNLGEFSPSSLLLENSRFLLSVALPLVFDPQRLDL